MGRKKLAVPWILFGITAIAFVILVLVIILICIYNSSAITSLAKC